ncbi:MAG: hypothetical protein HGB11_09630 [Chlorobiales bacterium]|nr:hypothetical protein [Chlorobiales bacterium]
MSIFNLYSKRQKKLRGEVPDVYTYNTLPEPLRVQIIHILRDAFGDHPEYEPMLKWLILIHDSLCREYGIFALTENSYSDKSYFEPITRFFLETRDIERALDVVEISFRIIDRVFRKQLEHPLSEIHDCCKISPDDAISELNHRFQEHGVGYQYASGEIIRIDSQILHSEVILPVLAFLSRKDYQGANEEFLKAHEHYRHGRYKECIAECLKSFESTMKTICQKRGWSYNQTDTAKKLIEILFEKKLIPDYLQSQFVSLRTVLESGAPTLRNKTSGHGQGTEQIQLPSYFAGYMLHLTGTNILFLSELDNELK